MDKIFISFIFIFINLTISVGDSRVGLVPDFVGYIILMKGLLEMKDDSAKWVRWSRLSSYLAVFTGVLYAVDLFNISKLIGPWMLIPDIVRLVISFITCYKIIQITKTIERKNKADYHTENLYAAYKYLCVGCSAALLMEYLGFSVLCSLAVNAIPYLWFLYTFYRTKECMLASE